MKSVLIDTYKIKNLNSGLGQFSLNFVNTLAQLAPEHWEINCLVPDKNEDQLNTRIRQSKASFVNRVFSNARKFDLWHSLHQFPSHLPNKASKQILTIHDLNFLVEKSGGKRAKYLKQLQKGVDSADVITTISNYSKQEIESHLDLKGKEVRMIYNGVSIEQHVDSIKPKYIGDKKFFFSIGILSRKKNFHTLLSVARQLEDSVLVLAGNHETSYGNEIKSLIKEMQLEEKVILPGMISESDKNWLYANCEALFFPSMAEGFGLPVIEAMMYGKPVFLSRYGSLPEIGGKLAFYFDDFSEEIMISTIKNGLSDIKNNPKKFKQDCINYSNKFSWESCINQYIDLYTEVLNP
ncbi:MAG: glycosyltransferase [Crocinitomicaceae bacterium]|nr:glycosyltransferase [Crocinitomicaceae bacterium]|tara:strand:- start:5114 stop:6166 length:1053 start_codon:yes stop_codon:yes gene_type:complete